MSLNNNNGDSQISLSNNGYRKKNVADPIAKRIVKTMVLLWWRYLEYLRCRTHFSLAATGGCLLLHPIWDVQQNLCMNTNICLGNIFVQRGTLLPISILNTCLTALSNLCDISSEVRVRYTYRTFFFKVLK